MIILPRIWKDRCRICRKPLHGLWHFHTELTALHHQSGEQRRVLDRKFTTAARDFLVDAFENLTEIDLFNFHASGTGAVAESNADTALGTEVEAARVSGTKSQPTSDVYRTVATITYTATRAITEHGVFSASSGGTLLDRTVFSVINVVNNDSITFTFNLTIAAEA